MGTAASSDLLVHTSITENTPGGNLAMTWHLCIRLSWHVDLPYMFKPSCWCIHFVFRHPSSWQVSVINSREPWDGFREALPGWSVQKTGTYGTKALRSNTPFRLWAPQEDSEGAKLLYGPAHLWIFLTRKAFLSLEKFMASP